MSSFLLVYDRRSGTLIKNATVPDGTSSVAARMQEERNYRDQPDVEVVVLRAASQAALRRTHRRYFQTAGAIVSGSAPR